MAVKKSELYSSLWNSCDELRGGMDASLYKDYVLTLLFVKYVTDRYQGDPFAEIIIPAGGSFFDMVGAKGKTDIGDRINKIIRKLAEANQLTGIIDVADFDDDAKLGSGKEKVDRLTNLVSIFQNEALDFRKNRAGGDDILGDAYGYLMKNFASQSGKSKGQFYTPAEVSRVMAKVIGISGATKASQTLYDPACGSGSLLIRAADEAPAGITIYGQEYDHTTAGLAKMNLVLHNKSTGTIRSANTLSNPRFKRGDRLERFDFAVANPPFSYKSWTNGIDPASDERFSAYSAVPPAKNGDFAWLIHFIHSLKPKMGKGAIILPHGVLFRGHAEAVLRREIIERRIIKGIIGLPQNLFFGTGIPACIIVIDKENAPARQGLFMIDASRGFVKDGNKNRLRERDIRKITDCFNQLAEIPGYARMIPFREIEANEYNLNIPRYIDSSEPEDRHDIAAHLSGGIPQADVQALSCYWRVFPTLRDELFTGNHRAGYLELRVNRDQVRETIYRHPEFIGYAGKVEKAFMAWMEAHRMRLNDIRDGDQPKQLIEEIATDLLDRFGGLLLIDRYDVYQCLMEYWADHMQDDVYALVFDGWTAGRAVDREMVERGGRATGKMRSFEGRVIPKMLLIGRYFAAEQEALDRLEDDRDEAARLMDQMKREQGGEDGLLAEVVNDKGNITKGALQKRIRAIKNDPDAVEELDTLREYEKLMNRASGARAEIRKAAAALDERVYEQYGRLSIEEIKDLVVEQKWGRGIYACIDELYTAVSHRLTGRIMELVDRYAEPLPQIEAAVADYEAQVKSHLERMGFAWR